VNLGGRLLDSVIVPIHISLLSVTSNLVIRLVRGLGGAAGIPLGTGFTSGTVLSPDSSRASRKNMEYPLLVGVRGPERAVTEGLSGEWGYPTGCLADKLSGVLYDKHLRHEPCFEPVQFYDTDESYQEKYRRHYSQYEIHELITVW